MSKLKCAKCMLKKGFKHVPFTTAVFKRCEKCGRDTCHLGESKFKPCEY